ncbi:hypothetical protein CfE428DRAFT_3882 [Chthoniobacter flavus Ellin428]|uniref:Uncharacterized protein n=1 Tax=Chthoniobacter flavus Ellin428 TaxID=497964 RepID=B4D4P4_9BACT|nr:hypothetical protein CfE428DRAFT_3882 [Chthoniobacter flavus Ellin428]TCO91042.1 hypothetical protein EV701_109195 [Chthoniobacter flavus]
MPRAVLWVELAVRTRASSSVWNKLVIAAQALDQESQFVTLQHLRKFLAFFFGEPRIRMAKIAKNISHLLLLFVTGNSPIAELPSDYFMQQIAGNVSSMAHQRAKNRQTWQKCSMADQRQSTPSRIR